MNYQRIAVTAALLWSCHSGFAQQASFTPSATILKDQITYVVQADGRYTKEEVEKIQINTDQSVKERSQLQMPFSSTLQALEVLQAYTITKDGKRIDVKPEEIREQQSPASAGAPMFDDHKVKVVVFPAVEIGARLGIHVCMTQKTPLFKGHFYDCKDKTTLLQALLAAKGIPSSTALINATDVYWLPSIAMPTTAFNHAITCIPAFNMFLDATPGKAMFGSLPPELLGKHALVIQNAKGAPKMTKVPLGASGDNSVQVDTFLDLNSQGQITGRSKIQATGYLDLMARQTMSSLPPLTEERGA